MMHKAWSRIEEVPYCFSRWYVKFQGHTALKIVEFDPNWAFSDCNSSLNSPMAMKFAWNSKGKMPYCFPRSSIKFQGHTVQNITDFDPNWAFPDCRPVAAFKSLRFALFSFTVTDGDHQICLTNLPVAWRHFVGRLPDGWCHIVLYLSLYVDSVAVEWSQRKEGLLGLAPLTNMD